MGYSTILDIIGSMFIGGILMLSLFQVNYNTIVNMGYYNTDFLLQSGLMNLVQVIERDMRRIGYSQTVGVINSTYDAIIQADTSSITIVGDVDNSGTVDTVKYYLGPTGEMAVTVNPRDRYLYRQVNGGTPQKIFFGVTIFSLVYYDPFNGVIPSPLPRAETGRISSIQISLQVESGDAYDLKYADVYWRQIRLSSKNLNNR